MKNHDHQPGAHLPLFSSRFFRQSALLTFVIAMAQPCIAQVYQWKDAEGKTVFTDSPPPGVKARAVSKGGEQDAPSAIAPLNGDKKPDAKKANPEKDKEAKAAAEKRELALREYCDSARNRLTELNSGMRIGAMDSNGERYVLTDEQRSAESTKLRQGMLDSKCP